MRMYDVMKEASCEQQLANSFLLSTVIFYVISLTIREKANYGKCFSVECIYSYNVIDLSSQITLYSTKNFTAIGKSLIQMQLFHIRVFGSRQHSIHCFLLTINSRRIKNIVYSRIVSDNSEKKIMNKDNIFESFSLKHLIAFVLHSK